jgi:hypothetical protein
MYIVTEEYNDGTWCDDPRGFDSELEARDWIKKHIPDIGTKYFLYRCYEIALDN